MSERSAIKLVSGKRPPATGSGEHPEKTTSRPKPKGAYPAFRKPYQTVNDGLGTTRADVDAADYISPAKPSGVARAFVSHSEKNVSSQTLGERYPRIIGADLPGAAKEVKGAASRAIDKQLRGSDGILNSNPKKRYGNAFGITKEPKV